MNRELFYYDSSGINSIENDFEYDIEVFQPTLFNLKCHKSSSVLFLFWYLFSRNKYFIVYVKNQNKIIHHSVCITKFYRFPFMDSNDLEIGPCWTDENYRGKGIYPYVLKYVLSNFKDKYDKFFIMTDSDNIASQKGILKAGFEFIGKGTKNVFGRYIIKEIEE